MHGLSRNGSHKLNYIRLRNLAVPACLVLYEYTHNISLLNPARTDYRDAVHDLGLGEGVNADGIALALKSPHVTCSCEKKMQALPRLRVSV